jgi:hypothetical protein
MNFRKLLPLLVSAFCINIASSIVFAVTIYENSDYQGRSLILPVGRYDYPFLLANRFNDILSSMKIPQGFKVTIFADPGFRGTQQTYSSDTPFTGNPLNDKTSSISVERTILQLTESKPPSDLPLDSVAVFKEKNFTGTKMLLREGQYSAKDIGDLNDNISSLSIPKGLVVILYDQDNCKGDSIAFCAVENALSPSNLGEYFDNKISSLKIAKVSG